MILALWGISRNKIYGHLVPALKEFIVKWGEAKAHTHKVYREQVLSDGSKCVNRSLPGCGLVT